MGNELNVYKQLKKLVSKIGDQWRKWRL